MGFPISFQEEMFMGKNRAICPEICTDTRSPFEVDWNFDNTDNGQHTWIATAVDDAGNSTNSEPVTVLLDIVYR